MRTLQWLINEWSSSWKQHASHRQARTHTHTETTHACFYILKFWQVRRQLTNRIHSACQQKIDYFFCIISTYCDTLYIQYLFSSTSWEGVFLEMFGDMVDFGETGDGWPWLSKALLGMKDGHLQPMVSFRVSGEVGRLSPAVGGFFSVEERSSWENYVWSESTKRQPFFAWFQHTMGIWSENSAMFQGIFGDIFFWESCSLQIVRPMKTRPGLHFPPLSMHRFFFP